MATKRNETTNWDPTFKRALARKGPKKMKMNWGKPTLGWGLLNWKTLAGPEKKEKNPIPPKTPQCVGKLVALKRNPKGRDNNGHDNKWPQNTWVGKFEIGVCVVLRTIVQTTTTPKRKRNPWKKGTFGWHPKKTWQKRPVKPKGTVGKRNLNEKELGNEKLN